MAKLLKITGYLVTHDAVNESDVELAAKQILASKFDGVEKPFKVESIALGENLFYSEDWNDHELNSIDCTIDTCESYFSPNLGFVIVNQNNGFYYNGMNQWKKDIRDAKIYHTKEGALDTAKYKFETDIVTKIKQIRINMLN